MASVFFALAFREPQNKQALDAISRSSKSLEAMDAC